MPDVYTQTLDDQQPSPFYVIPITRIDREQRIVEGVATSEAVDTFGTVFDYDASKKAFSDWAGNVREMHDRKAVGRRFEIRFDDAKRQVIVRSKISKGAQDKLHSMPRWRACRGKPRDGRLRLRRLPEDGVVGAARLQRQQDRDQQQR